MLKKGLVAEPGTVVGDKYRVVRTIGTGGMGVVYEARHIELGQRVALKLLQSGEDDELVHRFLREARAAARLKSDHAAKVMDVGRLASGAPYMVMELLTGKDLGDVCSAGPVPAPVGVAYILQACEAVAEAHALGIVHRDLKPSNLFLTERANGQPLVKVLDFGIAKMSRHEDNSGKLTGTGAVMGSPKYMSPEQLRSSRDVDERTDVWSLGVCLYELVSGHTPFESQTVAEIYVQVLRDPPTPIEHWVPNLPPGLASAIAKCLEKDPAQRFSSVFELASALEPFALGDGRGSAARISTVLSRTSRSEPPASIEQAILAATARVDETVLMPNRPARRRRKAWLVGGAFALSALASVGVGAGYLRARSRRALPPTSASSVASPQPIETAVVAPSSEPTAATSVVVTAASVPSAIRAPRPTSRASAGAATASPRSATSDVRPSSSSQLKTTFE